ncbi:MAG: ribonuclease P protein component [Victivallales bacterium]|nr:ribonuclease P protein component [Victivallales bacterium]
MKKDRNRSDGKKPDYSLPRSKILRGRRNFERLFEKSTVLTSDSIQFRYRLYNNSSEGCYIGFIAPKRTIRSAVKRNKAKRLMREVYRIHQDFVQDLFSENTFGFHGAFLARKNELTFRQIQDDMIPILKLVRERLLNVESQKKSMNSFSGKNLNSETKQT